MSTEILRWLHVVGAAVLLGTGAGIAFFMLEAVRRGEPRLVAGVAAIVVRADWVFTLTAALVQPVTGLLLARATGWPLDTGWIVASVVLYLLVGALWLPVVAIQIRLRALAESAGDGALPAAFHRLFRVWVACGVPAFALMLAILWLMVARPGA